MIKDFINYTAFTSVYDRVGRLVDEAVNSHVSSANTTFAANAMLLLNTEATTHGVVGWRVCDAVDDLNYE